MYDLPRSPGRSAAVPLLEGYDGTAQTIELIQDQVDQGLKDPFVRQVLGQILAGVPAHNDAAEVAAIYRWVLKNIRFTKDPPGKETVCSARFILTAGIGDCDDINAVLLPTLLGSAGHITRLVTVASNPYAPTEFTHVYSEVLLRGRWIAIDAARPGARIGRVPERCYRKQIWPLVPLDRGTSGLDGLGVESARRGVGQIDWSSLNQLIATGAQGATSIIKAANPVEPYLPYGTSSLYYPGAAPGTVAAGGTLSASSSWVWVAGLGIAGLFLFSMMRR